MMQEIQSVGIREFRANLHKYTVGGDAPITVTSHGETLGYYIPARKAAKKRDFDALIEASKQIAGLLAEGGVSEDDIVADFKKARNTLDES